MKKIVLIPLIVLSISTLSGLIGFVRADPVHYFRLLAVERYFDSTSMKSAQHLIEALIGYPNWDNSTAGYVSYIHLLSMYDTNNVDPACMPFLRGLATKANVQSEIANFLGAATPGEIVIFYYIGHGSDAPALHMDQVITDTELTTWLSSGGLPQAIVTVILDTCHSGSWVNDGTAPGTPLGPGRVVMAACTSAESAWGWGAPNYWGWFTHEGVTPGFSSGTDSDGDGWIDAAEDFAYAKPHTESYASANGASQHPVNYYGVCDGNVPLVWKDTTKPFPSLPPHLWPSVPEFPGSAMAIVAGLWAFFLYVKKRRTAVS